MLGKGFLLNILEGITSFASDPLGGITGFFEDIVDKVVDFFQHIWGVVLKAVYQLWCTAAQLLDCVQVLYGMFVGTIDVTWKTGSGMGALINPLTGEVLEGYSIETHNIVIDVFMSKYVLGAFGKILILSLFLLLIFSIIAIIKNEYSAKLNDDPKKGPGNAKGPIIAQALRSLMGFLCVPLGCLFCVIASGYLMQAIDLATSTSSQTALSSRVFQICASDCNRVRIDSNFEIAISGDTGGEYGSGITNSLSIFKDKHGTKLADYIDDCFCNATRLPTGEHFGGKSDNFANFVRNGDGIDSKIVTRSDPETGEPTEWTSYFDYKNPSQVFYFYDLFQFHWLIGFGTLFALLVILFKITLGAAARLYELALLFIISPGILAMAPLDGGEALKRWQRDFIGKVTMIYAPVLAINLYFILVGTLMEVNFIESINTAVGGSELASAGVGVLSALPAEVIQQIFYLFILISGLKMCSDSVGSISNILGSENMHSKGEGLSKTLQDAAATKYLMSKANSAKGKVQERAQQLTGVAKNKMSEMRHGVNGEKDEKRLEKATQKAIERGERRKAYDEQMIDALGGQAKFDDYKKDKENLENANKTVENKMQDLLNSGEWKDNATLDRSLSNFNNALGGKDVDTLSDDELKTLRNSDKTLKNMGDEEFKKFIDFKKSKDNQLNAENIVDAYGELVKEIEKAKKAQAEKIAEGYAKGGLSKQNAKRISKIKVARESKLRNAVINDDLKELIKKQNIKYNDKGKAKTSLASQVGQTTKMVLSPKTHIEDVKYMHNIGRNKSGDSKAKKGDGDKK